MEFCHIIINFKMQTMVGILKIMNKLKPLSHWTATVLPQLVTGMASGMQSSLETIASDSLFPRMCRQVAQSSHQNFEHVQKFYATKFLAK